MISVIILAYNSASFVAEAVDSVLSDRRSPAEVELIILDNASTDRTTDVLHSAYGRVAGVTLLRSEVGLGYAGGNNLAARTARGDILLVLNDDCVVERDSLSGIEREFAESPDLGILQCALATADGRNWESLGHYIDTWGLLHVIGAGCDRVTVPARRRSVFGAKGAALAIRRQVFEALDGFDPAFGFLFEETDLCWRAQLRGYEVAVSGLAVARHRQLARYNSGEAGLEGSAFYLLTRNRIRSMLKNFSFLRLLSGGSMHLALLVGYCLRRLIRGHPTELGELSRALWWNATRLKETTHLRRRLQATRTLSDEELIRNGKILRATLDDLRKHPLF